jgi:uncharacterized protein (DUF486 family)
MKLNLKTISIGGILTAFIVLAIAFQAIASALPQVIVGADAISNATITNMTEGATSGRWTPFGGFFYHTGLIPLALMAAVVLIALGAIGLYKSKSR